MGRHKAVIPMLVSAVVPPHVLNSSSLGTMQTWDNYVVSLNPRPHIGVFVFRVLRHMQTAWAVHHPATLPMLAVTMQRVWDPLPTLSTPFCPGALCPPHCLSLFTPHPPPH